MTSPLQVAMRTLALGVLAAMAALGQTVLNDANRIADARKLFETLQDNRLGCELFPVKPRTFFSLRLEAGYLVRLPSSLSQVPKRQWIALTRITPKGDQDQPVYLSQVAQSSIDEQPKIEGSYWLGEGRNAVEFLLFDSRGDVCRKDWEIDARMDPATAAFKPILEPGEVRGAPARQGARAAPSRSVGRLTILLHAASVLQRQTLLGELDKAMLLDGLVALMEELRAGSVQLVVFNLEQRRELFRKDGFTLEALRDVSHVLDSVQPGRLQRRPESPRYGRIPRESLQPGDARCQAIRRSGCSGAQVDYKNKPSAQFGLPPGTKQGFYYLECDPTRFLLPHSSTLNSGDCGAQGRATPFSVGAMQPGIPDDHVWKTTARMPGPTAFSTRLSS